MAALGVFGFGIASAQASGTYNFESVAFYAFSSQASGTLPVYRFYNGKTNDHFYFLSDSVPATPKNYAAEGIAFYAFSSQASGTLPVYRFYNGKTGDHFYFLSDSVPATPKDYAAEGVASYAYAAQADGTLPVYRFYNGKSGDHFYTISESEKNNLMKSTLGPEISVGLWNYTKSDLQKSSFSIDANEKYNIKDKNGKVIATVDGGKTTKVGYDSSGNFSVSGSIAKTKVSGTVNFDAADGDNSDLIFNVHRPGSSYDRYRGKIKLKYSDSSNIWVINTLPLEQYVWGDGEMAGTGAYEHTKVMATIFRTYGYWYIKYSTKYTDYGFKIRSDSGSQIYRGYDWETRHSKIKKAAGDTRSVVVTYDGDVALTPYCSWSDGKTRSFEDVWGSKDYPWCQSVKDPYGKNPDLSTAKLKAAGNHMVGLIAHGSLHLADSHGWSYSKILKYYYTDIALSTKY